MTVFHYAHTWCLETCYFYFILSAWFSLIIICATTDVVSIPKTNENFRLLYDTKGCFCLHSVRDDEAKVCLVLYRILGIPLSSCAVMTLYTILCWFYFVFSFIIMVCIVLFISPFDMLYYCIMFLFSFFYFLEVI